MSSDSSIDLPPIIPSIQPNNRVFITQKGEQGVRNKGGASKGNESVDVLLKGQVCFHNVEPFSIIVIILILFFCFFRHRKQLNY